MGISTSKDKELVVTDNDNIKSSNLNSQFLFRKADLGKSKSKCACTAAKNMNPSINLKDLQSLVSSENEHIFHQQFWNSKTFIINAVDNIKARKYIDSKFTTSNSIYTTYNKCLIDSGILGTKAHLQMIIPHATSCYCDSSDPIINLESFSLCGCGMEIPSKIENCIFFGRYIFYNNFNFDFWIDYIKEILKGNRLQSRFIKQLMVLANEKNIDKVIEIAVMKYAENFDFIIKRLLLNHSINSKVDYIDRY